MTVRPRLLRWQDLLMGDTNYRVAREYSWTYGGVGLKALANHFWAIWE